MIMMSSDPNGADVFARSTNPLLQRLRPYMPGPTAGEISQRYGVPPERIVKLSSNEAPLGPSPRVREAIRALAGGDELHRYPSSSVPALRESMAAAVGLSPQQVVPGAGSSETWPMIIRAFSRPGDVVLWVEPSMTSYGEAAVLSERGEVSVVTEHPFALDAGSIVRVARERAKVVFLSSPNNTTSRLVDPLVVRQISEGAPDAVVVVDEHYIEAADDYRSVTAVSLIETLPNLLVTRSLSKMYGLAGLRAGYAAGPETAIEVLMQFKPKWNINVVAEAAARAALEDQEHLEQNILVTHEGRSLLRDSLEGMDGVEMVPEPQGGFVLLRPTTRTAGQVSEGLFSRGVMVRPDLLEGYIRVSVGTKDQNETFLEALEPELRG